MILILKILDTLALAAGSGWAYRLGGSSHGVRWVRELGVGLAEVLCLALWFGLNWWLILVLGAVWIETTYFKSKGTDARWWNWLLVGISFAIVPLPWVIATHHWIGFAIRSAVLVPVITLWATFQGDVQWSEGGRGAWQILTIPLLFIG